MGDELETRVRTIVAEQLGVDLAEVTSNADILQDLVCPDGRKQFEAKVA